MQLMRGGKLLRSLKGPGSSSEVMDIMQPRCSIFRGHGLLKLAELQEWPDMFELLLLY